MTRLAQKKVVHAAVLDSLRKLQDKKRALMRQPGPGSTSVQPLMASTVRPVPVAPPVQPLTKPASSIAKPITGSAALSVAHPVVKQSMQPSVPAIAGRGRYTNSESDAQHKSSSAKIK
jgi:hypothetical protein